MDDFVMKLRHGAPPAYAGVQRSCSRGDPMWITEAVGGMGSDGRTLVTKTVLPHACIRFTIWGRRRNRT